ncbi:CASP8-associated protein 2 [Hippocampus comes]|uniref:CASP8-associated protein 2 n=1 Tax=Hippocampus comes TaxID=109280 RepID=UPI00094EC951|nr:PREDICTED: CASP8-associated protein 2 [Hippocampus comes]
MESTRSAVAFGVAINEDSVDIYDDLDLNHSKSLERFSPNSQQLKESMDLYEEIVTEEQQDKESSHTELQSRFQAAQHQIKELHRRLQKMEIENTGLNTENTHLKKNISALLRTARQEIMRKDAVIQRLNQSSGKVHYHHSRANNLHDQNSSSKANTISMRGIPESTTPSPLLHTSPRVSSSSRDSHPPKVPPRPPRRESPSPNRKANTSCTETRHSKGPTSGHGLVPEKRNEHCISNSLISSSTRHHGSDQHKTKDREKQCQKRFDTTDKKYGTSSAPRRDRYSVEKDRPHKSDKDTGRRYESRICKTRDNKNVDGYHRSERSKSPPFEKSHAIGSSDAYKARTGEKRHKTPSLDSQHSTHLRGTEDYSRHREKIILKHSGSQREHSDSKDQKRSSLNRQAENYSDFPKEMQRDKLSKDYQWKEDRQHEEMTSSHRRTSSSERSRRAENRPSEESHNLKRNTIYKERQGKTGKTSAKEPVEENGQNSKLCFMETLNLTLSPIKKTVPNNTIQEGLTALHHIFQNGPHDGLQSDLHARDQIDGNELKGTEKLLSDSVDSPTSKKLQVNDVQEKDTSDHETRLDTQQAEGNSIQAISSCQSIDSAANRMSTHHNPKAQGNTSRKRKDRKDDIKAKFRPDVQLDSHEQPDETEFNNLYGNVTGKQPSSSLQKVDSGRNKYQRAAVAQCAASSEKNSKGRVLGTKAPDKVMEYAVTPKHIFLPEDIEANPGAQQTYLIISQDSLPGVNPPLFSSPTNEDTHCAQDDFRDTDAVSSTINVELGPQQEVSLPEAINFFMKRDNGGSLSPVTDPSTSIGVSKVSSTTEEIVPPKNSCEFTVSPKKKSSEKTPEKNVELSISMPLLHDEDSMMRMLCHLKRIPDAISPLRSPIHLMKTSRHCVLGKPGHVKSLQKEFSNTADDANAKKVDLNKENKYPGCPLKHDKQDTDDKLSEMPSNPSDTELEEAGISSGSEEAQSSLNSGKRVKVEEKRRNKANLLKRKSEATSLASKEKTTIASVSTQSPRNKTACPKSAKASFSTIEEVMEMFTSLRSEIRKKYMKLHKTFPKKIFFSVMEHSRESLMQFVDGAHFGQICCQAVELKSKLKILIVSVFNKVADNGIVKRIFDQQAVDLKQKLWAFVDDQVEFLLKDVYMTLKSLCRPAKTLPEENMSSDTERLLRLPREKMQTRKDTKGALSSVKHIKPCAAPHQTGLGSKGKDIRISPTGNEKRHGHKHNYGNIDPGVDCTPQKSPVSEKHKMASLVASQSTSMLEKSDFELLTEQQATSLTFNLVRDSQMGEIFKCLLQGSDLLETNAMIGEGTSWALCTPKKNGERLISITTPNKFESPSKFLSPTKFDTPSKLIATWSSILPRDMSPPSKNRDRPNPALFDESCLLEVPSENQATLHSSCLSQRNYSILDEDLAVSLTIPSPLKSDSHLSFLQPSGLHVVSTPDSVISAHISEDALLDGEDATVQDIHLALDTDNSSLGSSNSVASPAALNTFVLKPELPMQALVMEKSNDHFIVKIRQGNIQTGLNVPTDETLVQTRTEEAYRGEDMAARERQGKYLFNEMHKYAHPCSLSDLSEDPVTCQDVSSEIGFTEDHFRLKKQPPLFDHLSTTSEGCATKNLNKGASPKATFKIATYKETFLEHTLGVKLMKDENPNPTFDMEKHSPDPLCPSETNPPESQNSTSPYTRTEQGNSESSEIIQTSQEMSKCSYMQSEMETSKSDRIAEDTSTATGESKKDRPKSEKRKKHQEPSKAKRPRKDEENTMEDNASSSKNDVKSKSLPSSPHSLSARNVIKKRGALVMTWTRDEDRAILVDLKTKGASRKTFAALSDKLKKPSEEIAQRFYQLMKLFKKHGNTNA